MEDHNIVGWQYFKAIATPAPAQRAIRLFLMLERKPSPETTEHVIGFQVKSYPDSVEPDSDGTCILHMKEAQRLLDDLYFCGLRPTKEQGSDNTIAAMEKHIASLNSEVLFLREQLKRD